MLELNVLKEDSEEVSPLMSGHKDQHSSIPTELSKESGYHEEKKEEL